MPTILETCVDLVASCAQAFRHVKNVELIHSYNGPSAVVSLIGRPLGHARPKMDNVIWLIATLILTHCPWTVFWGFSGLAPMYAFIGAFATTTELRIVNRSRNDAQWPSGPIFLSCHHRVTNDMLDMVFQFLVSPRYPKMQVVVAEHVMSKVKGATKYFFHSRHLQDASNKLQQLFDIAKDADCVSVFPDYDGSQFPGDMDIFFRPGLFAASMYYQRPIVDFCLLEPTAAAPNVLLDVAVWWPPNYVGDIDLREASNASEFRLTHESMIQEYARACEEDYKSRLQSHEACRLSCFQDDMVAACTGRARHTSWARNHKLPYKGLSRTIP
jgi:hypothetical protein